MMAKERRISTRRAVTAGVCAVAVAALSGCATTYDETLASSVPATDAATTSSVPPSGPADELLPRLVDEATGLSGLMMDGGDDAAAVRRIEDLWTAVKQEVNAARPDLLADFSTNVALTAHAVRFNRSADADKAAKNLTFLADAFLGR